jgi:hypothetical protein
LLSHQIVVVEIGTADQVVADLVAVVPVDLVPMAGVALKVDAVDLRLR